MYGEDRAHFPWSIPPRPRTTPLPEDSELSPNKRYSTGMYYGLDGSDSASSSGFAPVYRATVHSRSGSGGYSSPATAGAATSGGDAQSSVKQKVNQIVQAFFWKATMVIVQSRMSVVPLVNPKTQEKKTNKWFNIELDEQESFREEAKLWRSLNAYDPRPPPLIIEIYLDTSDLSATQALVILDSEGKRWNVVEALESATNRAQLSASPNRGEHGDRPSQQIVLERWQIELSAPFDAPPGLELPVVYKKGIILFRALYSYVSLMPTWKFRRRLSKLKLHTNSLKIGCRIGKREGISRSSFDGLEVPLYESDSEVTDNFQFAKVESPAGFFNISVSYRKNCEFKVDDSESLLSSHFINLDEHFSRPSLGHHPTASQPVTQPTSGPEAGSLPSAAPRPLRPDYNLAYGSLSSFHQVLGASGASPISALRNAGEIAEKQYNDSPERPPVPIGLRSLQGSKSSLRSVDGAGISRRGSITFMHPFKSPSLSASPASYDVPTGPSLGRFPGTPSLPVHRQRPSLGAMSPSSVKYGVSMTQVSDSGGMVHVAAPISASPKPHSMTRIASSFGSRRPRVSSAASRTEDDNNSSGKASYSSSTAAPGSGLFAEPGAGSYEEDIQIRDFMSMLADGQKQPLKSFKSNEPEGSSKRTANALLRFSKMRDSQSVLADSMSTSLLLQPSSSPSTASRQLANVPGMVSSMTFSTSSSPGKAVSPHTPHTPAIPSRLSEGLTAQYDQQQRDRQLRYCPRSQDEESTMLQEGTREGRATTSPLDIPLSPRLFGHRRSNSMTHQETGEGDTLDFDPLSGFGHNQRHSASLGSVDMVPLSLSQLASIRDASHTALPGREEAENRTRSLPENEGEDEGLAFGPPRPPSIDSAEGEAPRYQHRFQRPSGLISSGSSYRGRFSMRGRGNTPPSGSVTNVERERVISGSDRPGLLGRRTPSWSRSGPMGEDEDLLFAMSDMVGVQQSRRSLEQDRGGVGDASITPSRRRSRGAGVDSGSMRHWGI